MKHVATIIFSGELNPDIDAAEEALTAAGFNVMRMTEDVIPQHSLGHRDDFFFEVTKDYPAGAEGEMIDDATAIVEPYGGGADDCGPVDEWRVPFESRRRD